MSANDNTFRVDDFDGIQTADSGRLDGDIAKDSENRYIYLSFQKLLTSRRSS